MTMARFRAVDLRMPEIFKRIEHSDLHLYQKTSVLTRNPFVKGVRTLTPDCNGGIFAHRL